MLHRLRASLAAVLLLPLASCGGGMLGLGVFEPEPERGASFTIVNGTERQALTLVAGVEGAVPAADLLEGAPLGPGESVTVTPRLGAGCLWSVRMTLDGGGTVTRRGIDVCTEATVELGNSQISAGVGAASGRAATNTRLRERSSGTGFAITRDRLVTNHHVIEGCERIVAVHLDGRQRVATLVGSDRWRDLALLAIATEADALLPVRLFGPPRRGEPVVTFGYPLPVENAAGATLTNGTVAAVIGEGDPDLLQFTAPVYPGSSGGPLIDERGQVIGVITRRNPGVDLVEGELETRELIGYAVSVAALSDFLRGHKLAVETLPAGPQPAAPLDPAAIGTRVERAVYRLRCMVAGTGTVQGKGRFH